MQSRNDGMMECLALAPLKLIIWSSDKGLLRTNIFISAHPKTTIGRLLQYIHSQMYAESKAMNHTAADSGQNMDQQRAMNGGSLGLVAEFCLYYGSSRELRLDRLLQDLEFDESSSFIRLQFEKKRSSSGEPTNLEYDFEESFKTTNLQININALSVDKIMSQMELNVPLGLTMAGLKKVALKHLWDYETTNNSKNLCHVRSSHKSKDIMGFIVKGEQSPIYLDDANAELYDDLTLGKILGFDFAPQKHSYFTVMFKVKHGQSTTDDFENSITIEFISDSTLSMDKMAVTVDTSVEEVKEFICSAYTHSLRLSMSDIKLIYNGQLVHTLDFAGQPSKIVEYINGTDGAKIHVHINQEFNEPGPGFWSELFNNPDRFDFLPQTNLQAQSMLPTFSSQSRTVSLPMSSVEIQPASMEVENSRYQFSTESGFSLQSENEPYYKCLVDGKDEVFVPVHILEPASITLEINDSRISLSSLDYTIENGTVKLSPNFIFRLQEKFDMQIVKNSPIIIDEARDSASGMLDSDHLGAQQRQQGNNRRRFFTTVFPVFLLVCRTIYLIANNSIVPFFFVLELSTFLSWRYTAVVAFLFLLRTIWSTREIWEIWSDYFSLFEIDDESYIKIKEYVNARSLSVDFFKECESNSSVLDILMSSTLRDSRAQLYEAYHIDNVDEMTGLASLKSLLGSVGERDIEKGPIDDFVISCIDLYETTRDTMPSAYQDSMRKLLLLAKRDMAKQVIPERQPIHKKFFNGLKNALERFRQSQVFIIVLEHVVPDPRKDTLLVSIVKNLALFFLIILPPVKNKVDTILEERARAYEHSNEEEKEEWSHSQPDLHLLPEEHSVTTGLELHDQEGQNRGQ